MRSITRNRYSSGQVMKSAARDGDSDGRPPAAPGASARVRFLNRVFDVHTATVGQPADTPTFAPCGTLSQQLWTYSQKPSAARRATRALP